MEFLTVSLLNGVIYGLLLFMVSARPDPDFRHDGACSTSPMPPSTWWAPTWPTPCRKYVGFISCGVLSTLLVGLLGVIVERFFLRRVHKYGHAHELLLTFGLTFIIAELIKLFYGNFSVEYRVPEFLNFAAFQVFSTDYPFYRLLMGVVSLLVFGLIYLLLTRTRVGIVVRAAIHRPQMAEALGHNVPLVFMAVFGIGAALAGLAGALAGAFYTTNPNMALELGVIVFVVVVVGGLGSMAGAMVASLLIGLDFIVCSGCGPQSGSRSWVCLAPVTGRSRRAG